MRKTVKKIKTTSRAGFSFIEVMLSVFVVAIGIIASIQLMSANLQQTLDSKNQIIASELAQEGIELVRNMRDNNWATDQPTFANFPDYDSYGKRLYPLTELGYEACGIDIYSTLVGLKSDCWFTPGGGTNTSAKTMLKLSNGYYVRASNSESHTIFGRAVDFVTNADGSVTVNSVVVWGGWPANLFSDISTQCTTAAKCAWAQTTLSKWGGD